MGRVVLKDMSRGGGLMGGLVGFVEVRFRWGFVWKVYLYV